MAATDAVSSSVPRGGRGRKNVRKRRGALRRRRRRRGRDADDDKGRDKGKRGHRKDGKGDWASGSVAVAADCESAPFLLELLPEAVLANLLEFLCDICNLMTFRQLGSHKLKSAVEKCSSLVVDKRAKRVIVAPDGSSIITHALVPEDVSFCLTSCCFERTNIPMATLCSIVRGSKHCLKRLEIIKVVPTPPGTTMIGNLLLGNSPQLSSLQDFAFVGICPTSTPLEINWCRHYSPSKLLGPNKLRTLVLTNTKLTLGNFKMLIENSPCLEAVFLGGTQLLGLDQIEEMNDPTDTAERPVSEALCIMTNVELVEISFWDAQEAARLRFLMQHANSVRKDPILFVNYLEKKSVEAALRHSSARSDHILRSHRYASCARGGESRAVSSVGEVRTVLAKTISCNFNQEHCKNLLLLGSKPEEICGKAGTPLHYAVEGNHVGFIHSLISASPSQKLADELVYKLSTIRSLRGETPLWRSSHSGSVECTALLCDIMQRKRRKTPSNVERNLFDKKARTSNTVQHDGWTPLHAAAVNGSHECCKALLQTKVFKISQVTIARQTALHVACFAGHQNVVKLFVDELQKQGDQAQLDKILKMRDDHGQTCLSVALRNRLKSQVAIVNFLKPLYATAASAMSAGPTTVRSKWNSRKKSNRRKKTQ